MTKMEQAEYEVYMRKCLALAQIAKARGDSPVGSILVQNRKVVGEGIEGGKTHQDITFHAEIEAIRNTRTALGKTDLSDCILVTTHEPCIMCSYVIRHHKIKLIIVGLSTGEIGGYSSKLPLLLDKSISKWADPPKIIEGILEEECRALI
ncbi:MAG: nucleoside deaminase [Haliscomenobacter sp.]|nr:nucleoside deaminase [Haliscomenobacter sp.]